MYHFDRQTGARFRRGLRKRTHIAETLGLAFPKIPFYTESLSLRFLFDIVANLLLFPPFGYLFVRSQVTEPRAVFLRVTLLAMLLSVGVELVQVLSHTRIPSMTDICTNVIGAAIGAAIARKTSKERRKVLRELDCAGEQ